MEKTAEATPAQRVAGRLERHAAAIEDGTPLYAPLLRHVAEDVRAGGPSWALLRDFADERGREMLALRLMAAVHRLVLTGAAPALAAFFPTAGGVADAGAAWPALRALISERPEELRALLRRRMQTNEVGRCAALLLGFLTVHERFGLPLRVLELGSSAGLNLGWDRYAYRVGERRLGRADARVEIEVELRGAGRFRLPTTWPTVVARAGCDPNPLDVRAEDDRLMLRSSIWADDPARLHQLDAALEQAIGDPSPIERSGAGDWLARELDVREGAATVVFHSIVWQYVADEEQAAIRARIAEVGARATPRAPLAWLTLEPPRERLVADDPRGALAELRLTTWPDGRERLLARCGYHGRPVVLEG